MIKRILIFTISIVFLFIVSFSIHNYLNTETLSFILWHVYVFHAVAALIVYTSVELVASKMPNQAGYAYLMFMFFKIGAFVLIFQESVFAKDSLSLAERLALVLPLFLFLIAEAIGVARLLNDK
ncbi:DUF6168 family protein [Gaetbulibacter saemankumensis]|uniref:DUF6168 family protein n=1 Tax=Gaetbulibacter saemankumensis TaxID=311208 RepID=UPI00048254F0|nr:DUF6168 family protein [Gaetbulibacter saemankumensis]